MILIKVSLVVVLVQESTKDVEIVSFKERGGPKDVEIYEFRIQDRQLKGRNKEDIFSSICCIQEALPSKHCTFRQSSTTNQ